MQVIESEVRGLLSRMGYDASEWSRSKLSRRLDNFTSLMAEGINVDDDEQDRILRDKISEANNRGEQIEVVETKEPDAHIYNPNGTAQTEAPAIETVQVMETTITEVSVVSQVSENVSQVSQTNESGEQNMSSSNENSSGAAVAEKKSKTKSSRGEPKAKTTKPAIERDRLGNRKGTSAAHINTFLSRRPISAHDLAEKSGCSSARVHDQLFMLKQKGLIEKTDKGYALTEKAFAPK